MSIPSRLRARIGLLAVACAAGVPLAALTMRGLSPHDLLARQYRAQLAQADPEQVPELLHQIAELGDRGLPLLVEAMCGHDDAQVAVADRLLKTQLDQWRSLPPDASRRQVARLAHLLALHARDGSAESQRRAAELCTRILLWPLDSSDGAATELLADCDAVLRAHVAAAREIQRRKQAAARLAETASRESPPAHAAAQRPSTTVGASDKGTPPSLAMEPRADAKISAPTVSADQPPASIAKQETFISINTPPAIAELDGGQPHREAEATQPNQTPATAGGGRWVEPNRLDDVPTAIPTLAAGWDDKTDREVMVRLWDEDPQAVAESARELQRRGYSPTHVALAKQLVSPDPAVRLTLVETLPTISAFDPRLWLIWLTQDAEPAVRKAAIAVIATSSDPVLRAQLQTCEQNETDPEVLRFVRRALAGTRNP